MAKQVKVIKRVSIGLGILALVIVAAGGGYYCGLAVGEARANQARQFARGRITGQGSQPLDPGEIPRPGQQGGTWSGGEIVGRIQAIGSGTLVVETQEGNIRVKTTDTTLIEKLTSVDVGALAAGEQVMISGSENDDGSITARSIQSLRAFQAPRLNQPIAR